MMEKGVNFGVIDVNSQSPAHIDGTVMEISHGKKLVAGARDGTAIPMHALTPIELLALKGYFVDLHNIAVATEDSTSKAVGKAIAIPMVFAAFLAATASLE